MSEKIRLRTGHDFVHLDRGVSVAGSLTYGLSLGLRDKDGYLLKLNDLLDGSRTLEQVIKEFTQETGVSTVAIRRVLVKLKEEGHLEDLSIGTTLSIDEQIRYSRSLEYFSWINKMPDMSHWSAQEALEKSKVGIIGLGGVGSTVAMHMAGSGVSKLELIDYDQVELSNLNRQYIYSTESIGRYKAEEASRYVKNLNPNVEVTCEIAIIESVRQLREIFERVDLVFRCADKPDELPYWVSDAALDTKTPWVECSYNGPVVNVCTFVPGITGCYRCLREHEKDRLARSGQSQVYSDHVPDYNAVLGPIATIAGSLAAYEGLRLLTNTNPQSVGRALHQNMFDYSMSYVIDVPNPCKHYEECDKNVE